GVRGRRVPLIDRKEVIADRDRNRARERPVVEDEGERDGRDRGYGRWQRNDERRRRELAQSLVLAARREPRQEPGPGRVDLRLGAPERLFRRLRAPARLPGAASGLIGRQPPFVDLHEV